MNQEEIRFPVVMHDAKAVRPSHSGEYLVYCAPGYWLLTTYSTQYAMFGVLDERAYAEDVFDQRRALYSNILYWTELPSNL